MFRFFVKTWLKFRQRMPFLCHCFCHRKWLFDKNLSALTKNTERYKIFTLDFHFGSIIIPTIRALILH